MCNFEQLAAAYGCCLRLRCTAMYASGKNILKRHQKVDGAMPLLSEAADFLLELSSELDPSKRNMALNNRLLYVWV